LAGLDGPEDGKEVVEVDHFGLEIFLGGWFFFVSTGEQDTDLTLKWIVSKASADRRDLMPWNNAFSGHVEQFVCILEL